MYILYYILPLQSEPERLLLKQKWLWPARRVHPGCKCGRRGPASRLTNVWNGHPTGPCPGRGDASGGMGSDSDGAVRVVFGGEEVYSSSAKDLPNSLNREWVEHPFVWRDIVPRQHVCSLVHFARHIRRLQWAQIVLFPHKKVVRQRAESLRDDAVLVIYVWHPGPAVWAY